MDTPESWTEKLSAAARSASVGKSVPTRELLLSAEFTQRLDLVRHLTANSDRIPLVRGVHGIGKSTLLNLLLQQAPAEWEIYRIDSTPMLQPDQLIHGLCRHFSLQQENLAGVEQLIQKFTELVQTGRLPVIIIDDAEQLPVSTLRELFGIYSTSFDKNRRLALVLFASPQIDVLLEETRLQFASQKLQVLELLPLNREQSDLLVRHLLKVLEGQQELPLSEAGYEKIFRTSGGLPGKICQQVESILRPASTAPATTAKNRSLRPQLLTDVSLPVLIGGGILALLLILTLVYEDEINMLFEGGKTASEVGGTETVENKREIPLTLPELPMKVERNQAEEKELMSESDNTAELNEMSAAPDYSTESLSTAKDDSSMAIVVDLPQLTAAEEPPDQIEETNLPEQQPVEPTTPPISATSEATPPMEATASEEIVKEQHQPAKEAETTTAAPEKETLLSARPLQQEKKEKQKNLPAQVTELSRVQKPERKNIPEPVILTRRDQKPPPAPVVEDGGIKREAWLLRQAPGSFTLQLLAVGDEQAVAGFIQRHHLQGKAAYFRTKSNGRPWFPVLYGIYPSRSAAVAARAKLPKNLASQGVWPRSLASVQQAIREK